MTNELNIYLNLGKIVTTFNFKKKKLKKKVGDPCIQFKISKNNFVIILHNVILGQSCIKNNAKYL